MCVLGGLYFKVYSLFLGINPIDIATNAEGGNVTAVTKGEDSFFSLFQLGKLFAMLRRDALLLASIVMVVLLVCILYVNNSQKLAEKKADIAHKLVVIFLICSVLWILDFVVMILDYLF